MSSAQNLNDAIFQFECMRRGKKAEKPYRGYLLPNYLLLVKDGEQKAKYELPIELHTHIKWEVKDEIVSAKKVHRLTAFKFQQVKVIAGKHSSKIVVFSGKEQELIDLKNHLRNKIIFQKIQDFYTPLQTLGKGSSSRVLLVRHKTTELFYAAKCVDKQYVNEAPNGLESMFLEIEIQNTLEHNSFIKLYEVYEGDNTFYMVMDLLEGRSLHDELATHKDGFPIEICKQIMIQILGGLSFMHSKNIMHRDLKPENIMLQKKGDLSSLKIVDFGLATYCDVDKFLFPKCGTPGYVAPEIANLSDKSQKYDKVCDVFSAGVIFFKILTGKDLFPGTGFHLVLKLNKQCKIDTTPLQIKKIPQAVIVLIQKMLEKDPTQRPDAMDILKDPFFANVDLKQTQSSSQKKAFFQNIKEQNQKISQTQEFHPSDNSPSSQQSNPFVKPLGIGRQQQVEDNEVGSLVMNDNSFKGLNQGKGKKQMAKFNTSEFGQYDLGQKGEKQQQQNEVIYEEEETKEQQK